MESSDVGQTAKRTSHRHWQSLHATRAFDSRFFSGASRDERVQSFQAGPVVRKDASGKRIGKKYAETYTAPGYRGADSEHRVLGAGDQIPTRSTSPNGTERTRTATEPGHSVTR